MRFGYLSLDAVTEGGMGENNKLSTASTMHRTHSILDKMDQHKSQRFPCMLLGIEMLGDPFNKKRLGSLA